jgi:hypothetical protein
MNNNVEWWLVSSGVMVVAAVLGDLLHEKLQELEKRLNQLEGRRRAAADGSVPAGGSLH